ncbi:hypothetical protein ACU8KH_00925 [Lachancea thermotolerans]
MSTAQKQDLVIFSDHSVLSRELFSKDLHHVLFVTHKLGTAPSWLINALVETQVLGFPATLNESHAAAVNRASNRKITDSKCATVASFIHNRGFFTSALKKLKVDAECYNIIDYMTDFVLKNYGKPASKVLSSLLEELSNESATSELLILEQPELLVHLLNITSDQLHLELINPLIKKFPLLVVVSYTEAYENVPSDSNEKLSSDMIEQIRFCNSCFFKSAAVLGLKPLATGHASDVSGTLTITRGGASLSHLEVHVVENEYLFLTQKDTTKLFYR